MTKQKAMKVVRYYMEANDFDREKAAEALAKGMMEDFELYSAVSCNQDEIRDMADKYTEVLH